MRRLTSSAAATVAGACLIALASMSHFAVASHVRIISYPDDMCLSPPLSNISTSYEKCEQIKWPHGHNGVYSIMVNTPSVSTNSVCAYMTSFGDSSCAVVDGNMHAMNSVCGECQAGGFRVMGAGYSSASISVYCGDQLCQEGCLQVHINQGACTYVSNTLGYVTLTGLGPCMPVTYALSSPDAICAQSGNQTGLAITVPSGVCHNGIIVTHEN